MGDPAPGEVDGPIPAQPAVRRQERRQGGVQTLGPGGCVPVLATVVTQPTRPSPRTRAASDRAVPRMMPSGPPEARTAVRTLSVLYLFAGEDRKASIKGAIVDIARVWAPSVAVDLRELDVCQGGAEHDLSDPERQADIVDQVRRGAWHWVILSPPCNTWSRAVWSNPQGPRPVRSHRYPLGFPWLSRADRAKAELGNCLALFAARVAAAACEASVKKHFVRFTLEHPEDLGATPRGSPASIWQLDEVRRLTELGAHAVSFAFW